MFSIYYNITYYNSVINLISYRFINFIFFHYIMKYYFLQFNISARMFIILIIIDFLFIKEIIILYSIFLIKPYFILFIIHNFIDLLP